MIKSETVLSSMGCGNLAAERRCLRLLFLVVIGVMGWVDVGSTYGQQVELPTYTVQIVKPDGQPLGGATAHLTMHRHSGVSSYPAPQVLDADGQLEVPKFPSTMVDLIVISVRDEKRKLGGVFAIDEDVKQQLNEMQPCVFQTSPTVDLHGRVIEVDTASPMENVEVQFLSRLHPRLAALSSIVPAVTSDENGRFVIRDMIAGVPGYMFAKHDEIHETNMADHLITPTESDEVHRVAVARKAITEDSRIQPIVVPDTSALEPLEAIDELRQQYESARKRWNDEYNAAPDAATRFLIARRRLPNRPYLDAALKIADANRGTEIEREALIFCITIHRHTAEADLEERNKLRTAIGNRIAEDYLACPEIEECLTELVYSQADPLSLTSRLVNENPSRNVKGKSLLIRAEHLMRKADMASRMNIARNGIGTPEPDEVQELESSAMETLNQIIRDFDDVPYWRNGSVGEMARGYIRELLELNVGQLAPNFKAENIDGELMELAQFRGKIVVLDFWGSWCGPCISELPELNALAERFPDDVVVLGVMNDTIEDARAAIEKHHVSWQNWVQPEEGPILKRYNIDSWPTTYIIDRDGMIRYTDFPKTAGVENYRVRIEALLEEEQENKREPR